jgi:hypothetical protein
LQLGDRQKILSIRGVYHANCPARAVDPQAMCRSEILLPPRRPSGLRIGCRRRKRIERICTSFAPGDLPLLFDLIGEE